MAKPPHVLFLFLDGVGIGKKDLPHNPFFALDLPVIKKLLGGSMPHRRDAYRSFSNVSCIPVSATLQVPGLPQSGTGQTTLLTGVNAAKMIGKHFGPYPYSTLRPLLNERNIFLQLHRIGRKGFYVNAFPQRYFDYINVKPARTTAITSSWLATGSELNSSNTLANGEALSADITGERWNKYGFPPVPVLTPQQAGERFVHFARHYDFVLFEYYETDHAGHSRSMDEAKIVLSKLDLFIEGILAVMDYSSMLLIVTSDHGNLEDLSTKSHTRNPVPLIAVGNRHREFIKDLKTLSDILPAIIKMFSEH